MIEYTIKLNGQYYGGEDLDAYEAKRTTGTLGGGWHNHTGSRQMNKLVWEEEPYIIHGTRNLKSHLDRIMVRVEMGLLDAPLRLEIDAVRIEVV